MVNLLWTAISFSRGGVDSDVTADGAAEFSIEAAISMDWSVFPGEEVEFGVAGVSVPVWLLSI